MGNGELTQEKAEQYIMVFWKDFYKPLLWGKMQVTLILQLLDYHTTGEKGANSHLILIKYI